jgi:DNA-binding transcriptional LysR family regulator
VRLDVKMEIGSNEAIKQAVAGGLGLSILSLHALGPDAAPSSLVALNVEGFPIRRHWYIVHPAGKKLSVVAQAFYAYLKAEGSQIKFPRLAGFSDHGGTVQRA